MNDNYLLIYLLAIGAGGAVLIWIISRRISSIEDLRRARVKKLRRFEAVRTSTPLEEPIQELRETALESISTRFSIIKKVVTMTLILLWVLALLLPFMNRIPTAVASILVAGGGILIGVAARPFLENVVSGIVISFSHPLRIGDTVLMDGNYGTVEDISLTHTIIKIWNWRRYIVPNSRMLAKEFINYTISDTYQWLHVEFWVAHDADLQLVQQIAIQAASDSQYFSNYEPPRFWVMEMAKEGIKCWIAAWANSPTDAWQLSHDIRTQLAVEMKKAGIRTHQYELGPKLS
jgi:small-conductance mechanosensitive channel